VESTQGSVTPLTLVVNRKSPVHVGKLKAKEGADVLVSACGHWGSGAEYL